MNQPAGKELCALLGIILVAALLRVHNLGEWPLFGDEVNTIVESRNFSIYSQFAETNRWTTVTNSLSHFLTHCAFSLFGESLFAARLMPLCFGILTIPVFYFLLRRLYQARVARLTLLLVAFSPNLIFISGFARYNSMLFFFGGSAFLAFLTGLQQKRTGYLICGFLLAIFAVLAHITGLMIVGVMILVAVLHALRQKGERQRAFVVVFCILFASIALCAFCWNDLVWLVRVIMETFMGKGLGYSPPRMAASIAYNDGLLNSILVLLALILAVKRRDAADLALAFCWVLPFSLIMVMGFWFDVGPRYLHSALPAFYVLAGLGLHAWLERMNPRSRLSAAFLVAFVLVSHFPLLASNLKDGGRYDTKAATRFMMDYHEASPESLLFAESHMIYEYASKDVLDVNELPSHLGEFLEVLDGAKEALIVFPLQRKIPKGIHGREFRLWLERNCKLLKTFSSRRYDFMSYEISIYRFSTN